MKDRQSFRIEDIIVYEDSYIMVCHKPAGIAVQNNKVGAIDLESAIMNYLSMQTKVKTRETIPYLAVIHRLDQPVEGLLLFAKKPEAAKILNQQMQQGKVEKRYLAIVQGKPEKEVDILTHELEKDGRTNTSRAVPVKTAKSKKAVLSYQVLKRKEETALLSVLLHTGRHHQIRIQMAAVHMPLLGDTKYNPDAGMDKKWQQIALCACYLSFIHPKTREQLTYAISPTGENFHGYL